MPYPESAVKTVERLFPEKVLEETGMRQVISALDVAYGVERPLPEKTEGETKKGLTRERLAAWYAQHRDQAGPELFRVGVPPGWAYSQPAEETEPTPTL